MLGYLVEPIQSEDEDAAIIACEVPSFSQPPLKHPECPARVAFKNEFLTDCPRNFAQEADRHVDRMGGIGTRAKEMGEQYRLGMCRGICLTPVGQKRALAAPRRAAHKDWLAWFCGNRGVECRKIFLPSDVEAEARRGERFVSHPFLH